jgi:hypothetical protein
MELGFLKEKIGVGLSIQYTSFMISLDRVFEQDFAQLEGVLLTGTQAFSALKSYRENNQRGNTLIDPRISYKFSEKAKLTFVCKNALNQQIMERPAFLSMPRNYNIQLDLEF